MKAIAVRPGVKRSARLVDRPVPRILAADEVKAKVLHVGVCGTDRDEIEGGRAKPPEGSEDLVIGHEMLGQVVEIGGAVQGVRPGDRVVFTVRRGCGRCRPCRLGRSDLCRTGLYRERGIWGLDGYQTEFAVEREQNVVHVPDAAGRAAVLTEPLSIVEKVIEEMIRVQANRLPDWSRGEAPLRGRHCLVAGLGPVGLLAALVLHLRGAEVFGLDILDADAARPRWLASIGGTYIDGREVPPDRLDEKIGAMNMIVEATGVPGLALNLLDALDRDGIYGLTGIPDGAGLIRVPGAELMRQLVLQNQVMMGSVNASKSHFAAAVADLALAERVLPGKCDEMITGSVPFDRFEDAFDNPSADSIKTLIDWNP
ncbi:MAG: glucose 1-dehydrogenase [Candidatus Eisenbacteria bacterium]|nr:glucose 1-dehydrogenase [Candidatus Eisenbacteria bacterium]